MITINNIRKLTAKEDKNLKDEVDRLKKEALKYNQKLHFIYGVTIALKTKE